MIVKAWGKTQLVVVTVAAAVIGAAAQAQFQAEWAPWARWLTIAAIGVIVVAILSAVTIPALRSVGHWLRERRIDSNICDEVDAAASSLKEATTRSITVSAGSILNSLHGAGQLSPELVSEYGCHLGTLWTAMNNVSTDLKARRLRATDALARLVELQADYIRLCSSLAPAVTAAHRPDLQRDWDAIRERANAISANFATIIRVVESKRGAQAMSTYFENVPRA